MTDPNADMPHWWTATQEARADIRARALQAAPYLAEHRDAVKRMADVMPIYCSACRSKARESLPGYAAVALALRTPDFYRPGEHVLVILSRRDGNGERKHLNRLAKGTAKWRKHVNRYGFEARILGIPDVTSERWQAWDLQETMGDIARCPGCKRDLDIAGHRAEIAAHIRKRSSLDIDPCSARVTLA